MTKNMNSNWEILTKNLFTFNDKMGLTMKNFNILGVHWKIRFLRGGGKKEGGGVFEGGIDTLMHTMAIH